MDGSSSILSHHGGSQAQRWAYHGMQGFCTLALATALLAPEPYATIGICLALVVTAFGLTLGVVLGGRAMEEMADREARFEDARQARIQVEELFSMTDMLQSAEGNDDAGAVLMSTSLRLLPEFSGALYVFNNSRDRLDLVKCWNASDGFTPAKTLLPANCWALKRGKPHVNDAASHTLCCMHHIGQSATVEIPMMARGAVYGLLVLGLEADDALDRLTDVSRLGQALADSMSLALSNISLQEKLRTQSLRDPLTGLYNRRYMEDALDRYASLAERSGSATSVIMIDLDNFKKLNDEHGHAKGDAVLRDVAAQLVGGLRPSDVVSRYGGEELLVILPGCNLDEAVQKAEMLRLRVEALTEVHGAPISASFGVASVPETATSPVDIIPRADAALYAAKQSGKNRVAAADRRACREESQPRLVS